MAFCEGPKQNSDDYGYTSYDGLWSLMKERGLTKKELISKSGISSKDYDLMNNKEDVNLKTLRKLCKLFNCNYGEIIRAIFSLIK